MESSLEHSICRSLRPILSGLPADAHIADSKEFRNALCSLAWFIPTLLRETHAEWGDESLDGILPLVARVAGGSAIEIVGYCILISDQTLAALHLRLRIASSDDKISWLECKLGELGKHGMARMPYDSAPTFKRLYALACGADVIDWAYKVAFGHKDL